MEHPQDYQHQQESNDRMQQEPAFEKSGEIGKFKALSLAVHQPAPVRLWISLTAQGKDREFKEARSPLENRPPLQEQSTIYYIFI
ncbi:MAG: hypothetical protein KBH75_04985 [Saprospiraceae bacterium]|nr:hypothetical protein [Saprospiraceae bacterium]